VNKKTLRDLTLIAITSISSTFLVWLPFLLRIKSFWGLSYPQNGLFTLWQNFDGLNYIAVAKSWYNPEILRTQFGALGQGPQYFAAHFPLYPVLIWIFAPFFGFLNGMLLVTMLFTALSAGMFYLLVKESKLTHDPLFLTIVFLFLPARWVVVRSVGAPEPIFIFVTLAAFYFLKKEKYLLMGVACALSVLTKSPGILLSLAIVLYLKLPTIKSFLKGKFEEGIKLIPWKAWPIILAPIALVGIFALYQITYKDFFAYFHSGDNIHLFWPPFSIFNRGQFWVGTFWLEHVIFAYLLVASGIALLFKKKLYAMGIFTAIYFIASLFVAHLDITRYLIPTAPFVIIGMEGWLTTKEFKWIFVFMLIPIYLFAQNFIIGNTAPITDFTPFR